MCDLDFDLRTQSLKRDTLLSTHKHIYVVIAKFPVELLTGHKLQTFVSCELDLDLVSLRYLRDTLYSPGEYHWQVISKFFKFKFFFLLSGHEV